MLELIDRALAEDVGAGDLTTAAVVAAGRAARARIEQKAPGVPAGLRVAEEVFERVDPELRWHAHADEGEWREPGLVAEVAGSAASILAAERVALNFLGRLSGVATLTARYVRGGGGHGVRILDTRKTTPGLRALEKEAVRAGGGVNHRGGLYDAILVKENHARWPGAWRRRRGGAGRRRRPACRSRSSARRSTSWPGRSPPGCRGSCSTTWRRPSCARRSSGRRARRARGVRRRHAGHRARRGRDRRGLHQRRRADAFGAGARRQPAARAAGVPLGVRRRRSTANGSVTSRSREPKRYTAAGRPPSRPGRAALAGRLEQPPALEHAAQVGGVDRIAERGGVDARSARRSRTLSGASAKPMFV